MTEQDLSQSNVRLTDVVVAADRQNGLYAIVTVGEAFQFMQSIYSSERTQESDWKVAENALISAAATNEDIHRRSATVAFRALLTADRLLRN
jgi:hypothetical protein